MAEQKFGVLAGEDIVGNHPQAIGLAQALAERLQQRGLAAADRPTDTSGKSPCRIIATGIYRLASGELTWRGEGFVGMRMIVMMVCHSS